MDIGLNVEFRCMSVHYCSMHYSQVRRKREIIGQCFGELDPGNGMEFVPTCA